jgi:hypothetical protein
MRIRIQILLARVGAQPWDPNVTIGGKMVRPAGVEPTTFGFGGLRRAVGHGLAPHAGDVRGGLGDGIHEDISQGTGDLDILCAERDAHPFLGVVVLVNRVVAPVGAVVLPDVVVGIKVGFRFHAPFCAACGTSFGLGSKNSVYDKFRTRPSASGGP